MCKISFKIFNVALCFALISAIFLSLAVFDARCEDLRKNVLRLHIIANSDNADDQNLKLEIRDEILSQSTDLFDTATDITTAKIIAEQRLSEFKEIAEQVISDNGFDYTVSVKLDKSFFETRVYDDFTLPAGIYDSLLITIGEGKGKNWWCVIFPEICVSAASKGDLTDTVTNESANVAKSQKRYKAEFKIVEVYQKIKKLIK